MCVCECVRGTDDTAWHPSTYTVLGSYRPATVFCRFARAVDPVSMETGIDASRGVFVRVFGVDLCLGCCLYVSFCCCCCCCFGVFVYVLLVIGCCFLLGGGGGREIVAGEGGGGGHGCV